MEIEEWIERVSRVGGVCRGYMEKIRRSEGVEGMYRVMLDVNGGEWLFKRHAEVGDVPVGEGVEYFRCQLGDREKMEYPGGYTSRMYIRESSREIEADSTILYLLECRDIDVIVRENRYPSIVISSGSSVRIAMMYGAMVNIEVYGDVEYSISGDMSKVRIRRK